MNNVSYSLETVINRAIEGILLAEEFKQIFTREALQVEVKS